MKNRIKRPYVPGASALLFGMLCIDAAHGNSGTPPSNHTGAPGHLTCARCHTSTGSGNVTLIFSGGTEYEVGQLYSLLVTVTDPGQQRFGFSMVARDADNNTVDVGTWRAGGTDTQTHGPGGNHVGHRNAPRVADSHTFRVNWNAPASTVGDLTFYVAANAANGDGRNGVGDRVYLSTLTIGELVITNQPPSFTVPGGILEVPSGFATPVAGISIDDADAGDGNLTVTMSVQNGLLTIADSVAGGVGAGGISDNESPSVTIDGTLAELNATFSEPDGVIYRSNAVFTGSDTLQLLANDNGNTGGAALTGEAAVSINLNPVTYAEWESHQSFAPGEGGALSDPDRDGCPNIREFFGGTLPLDASDFDRPFVRTAPGGIEMVYQRAKAITGLDEQVEESGDLNDWGIRIPDPADVSITDRGDVEEVVIAISISPGALFIRHGVSIQSP